MRDTLRCPDPMQDWEGYLLWCECFACAACDGIGEDCDDGELWVCPRCEGTGIDPSAQEAEEV